MVRAITSMSRCSTVATRTGAAITRRGGAAPSLVKYHNPPSATARPAKPIRYFFVGDGAAARALGVCALWGLDVEAWGAEAWGGET